jgi:hypothetical protein
LAPLLNPYSSPQFSGPPIGERRPLPVDVTILLVVDLLLLSLRAALVVFGLVGLTTVAMHDPMVLQTGWFEVGAGLAMVLLGFPADIALLARQRWGVWLAYGKVAATFGSIGVGIWQGTYFFQRFPANSPEMVGVIIGITLVSGWRVLLIAMYVFAILRFSRWARQSAELVAA